MPQDMRPTNIEDTTPRLREPGGPNLMTDGPIDSDTDVIKKIFAERDAAKEAADRKARRTAGESLIGEKPEFLKLKPTELPANIDELLARKVPVTEPEPLRPALPKGENIMSTTTPAKTPIKAGKLVETARAAGQEVIAEAEPVADAVAAATNNITSAGAEGGPIDTLTTKAEAGTAELPTFEKVEGLLGGQTEEIEGQAARVEELLKRQNRTPRTQIVNTIAAGKGVFPKALAEKGGATYRHWEQAEKDAIVRASEKVRLADVGVQDAATETINSYYEAAQKAIKEDASLWGEQKSDRLDALEKLQRYVASPQATLSGVADKINRVKLPKDELARPMFRQIQEAVRQSEVYEHAVELAGKRMLVGSLETASTQLAHKQNRLINSHRPDEGTRKQIADMVRTAADELEASVGAMGLEWFSRPKGIFGYIPVTGEENIGSLRTAMGEVAAKIERGTGSASTLKGMKKQVERVFRQHGIGIKDSQFLTQIEDLAMGALEVASKVR